MRPSLTALLVGMLSIACGADPTSFDDSAGANDEDGTLSALFPFCAEARGALFELAQMRNGNAYVDTSTLDSAESSLRRLAEQVSAPPEVVRDIDAWKAALATWSDARTAIPPTFEGGRLIEPDTSEIDNALMSELAPIRERLGTWHVDVCGEAPGLIG